MSPRTAVLVIALALLGVSVVGGREAWPPAPPPEARPAREVPAPEAPPLGLDRLQRPGLGEPLAHLFATPRPAAPAARAARPAPPPAPVAPPLPFRYLGRYVDGGRAAVYLARGDEPVLAVQGETLPGGYRVEEVAPDVVTLIYVPLGTRQRLPVSPHP
ncbi:MAG TPA: hypothetical protein VFS80_02750 [Burkholderiales bacterium]|nr:hypothetical protein [Burkholderiales bacterium]